MGFRELNQDFLLLVILVKWLKFALRSYQVKKFLLIKFWIHSYGALIQECSRFDQLTLNSWTFILFKNLMQVDYLEVKGQFQVHSWELFWVQITKVSSFKFKSIWNFKSWESFSFKLNFYMESNSKIRRFLLFFKMYSIIESPKFKNLIHFKSSRHSQISFHFKNQTFARWNQSFSTWFKFNIIPILGVHSFQENTRFNNSLGISSKIFKNSKFHKDHF